MQLIPELISLLVPSTKKKERNNFTAKVKKETILKQKDKCAICRGRLNRWERDFHHKDGNKSNNNLSDCRAVHTRCHRKKHAEAYDKNDKSWSNWTMRAWIPLVATVKHRLESAVFIISNSDPEYIITEICACVLLLVVVLLKSSLA